ncbi:hypothetical protein E2C01_019044 [Portunus trituberculatus]|uniref:Uncharacterized protein n=1 Tax=Portunus trituberculatus TaxID=210409 RepID=A0A5B7DXT8_PORTR|nr:hypothetical protein [Portunus trituberculatus]
MSTPTAKEGKLQVFYAVHQTGNIGPENCNGIKETAMRPNNKINKLGKQSDELHLPVLAKKGTLVTSPLATTLGAPITTMGSASK